MAATRRATQDGQQLQVEVIPLAELHPHPRNYRRHPADQLSHIQQSLEANGQYRNVVIANDGTILAGHGVVEAAQAVGLTQVACIRLPLEPDDPRAIKVLTGDNEIAGRAEVDTGLLGELLQQVADLDDLLGTGYTPEMLASLLQAQEPDEVVYTDKVVSPIYEPSGPQPPVKTLTDVTKRDALMAEVASADLPQDVRTFLILAAHRHTRFDYEAIANYYAHAPEPVQRLMEQSALVIIDYDQAVEQGFIRLHDSISEAFQDDHPDA
jgi:hypothetical protein